MRYLSCLLLAFFLMVQPLGFAVVPPTTGGGSPNPELVDDRIGDATDPCPREQQRCKYNGCDERYFCTSTPCEACCSACNDYVAFKDFCTACVRGYTDR
jgi:hypothetical protein